MDYFNLLANDLGIVHVIVVPLCYLQMWLCVCVCKLLLRSAR